MPDKRKHRGPHPSDHLLFSPKEIPKIKEAILDLSWLLSKGYSEKSALNLVGDRYQLKMRQRMAVLRCVSRRDAIAHRKSKEIAPLDLAGKNLSIDGFNLLITIESAVF